MMKINSNRRGTFVIVLSIFLITVLLTSVSYLSYTNVFAVQGIKEQKYTAQLSGDQEVPPVQTNALGMGWFNPIQDNVGIKINITQFKINVTNIQGVTAAHIHIGKQGENGPLVVPLVKYNSPSAKISGKLAKGNITADTFEGPMKGKQISDLTTAMQNGSTYVNVHTEKYPNGEIRGQIMSGN